MAQHPPSDTALRVSELSHSAENRFALRPEGQELTNIATALELSALRKLSFEGLIKPLAGSDWTLEGRLGATVVQPCVVTLEPVTTRIDIDITRQFIRGYEDPDEPEAEMPEDDTVDPLGTWIDPAIVMQEALSIAVPDYPRKESAELGEKIFAEPGTAPMTDADARPFAGLADLKSQLENPDD